MNQNSLFFLALCVVKAQLLLLFPAGIWIQNQFNFSVAIYHSSAIFIFTLTAILISSVILTLILPKLIKQLLLPFLAFLSVMIFIQQYLLVGNYGLLDGQEIIFETAQISHWINFVFWPLGLICLAIFRVKIKQKSGLLLLFSFLSSTLILVTTVINSNHNEDNPFTITENDKFSFSQNKNVLLFILDGFQSDLFWQIIDQEPKLPKHLTGFEFYPDTAAVFAKTYPTIPILFTGKIYQKQVPIKEYLNTVYQDSLLTELVHADWDVGLYPYLKNLIPVHDSIMSNSVNTIDPKEKIENYLQALDLTLFRTAPHFLKSQVYNDGKFVIKPNVDELIKEHHLLNFNQEKPTKLPTLKKHRGLNFLENLKSLGNTQSKQPTFRFYHLLMPHSPFLLDRNLKPKPKTVGFKAYHDYAYASIKLMIQILDAIKSLGIYDQSAIIIMADHGGGEYNNLKYDVVNKEFKPVYSYGHEIASGKPLLMVKNFNENKPFEIVSKPISLLDIMPTLAELTEINIESAGIPISSIKYGQSRTRPYYFYRFTGFDSKYLDDFSVFDITGDVYLESSWKHTGTLVAQPDIKFDDKYQLNKTARFGRDIKIDASHHNQFLSKDSHTVHDSFIESSNHIFQLSIPLAQPLFLNKTYQFVISIPLPIHAQNLKAEINNKKFPLLKVANEKNLYHIPFIADFKQLDQLSVTIEKVDTETGPKLTLSHFILEPTEFNPIATSAPGLKVDFSQNIEKFQPIGFWPAKTWGRWTAKNQASIRFLAPDNLCQTHSIHLNIYKFYNQVDPEQFKLFFNDVELELKVEQQTDKNMRYTAHCSLIKTYPNNIAEIKFQTNTTVSAAAINQGKDRRKNGVGIKLLEFNPL